MGAPHARKLGLILALARRLVVGRLRERSATQVACFDDLRLSVSILPPGLDLNRFRFANDTKHHGVTGSGALDGLDSRLSRRERQQDQDLSKVVS